MSLKSAIADLVEQMEKDLPLIDEGDESPVLLVRGYIREMKAMLKVAGEDAPTSQGVSAETSAFLKDVEAREVKRKARQEEQTEPSFRMLQGGQCDGDLIPTNPQTPKGAYTRVGVEVYQYDGEHWQFVEGKE